MTTNFLHRMGVGNSISLVAVVKSIIPGWTKQLRYPELMEKIGGSSRLSAGDLVGYLNCRHLTALDRAVAEGARAGPKVWDPLLEILRERALRRRRGCARDRQTQTLFSYLVQYYVHARGLAGDLRKAKMVALSRDAEMD